MKRADEAAESFRRGVAEADSHRGVWPRLTVALLHQNLAAIAEGKGDLKEALREMEMALVVASNVGGHREMVFPGKTGLLFKAGNASSLADACIQLMNRPHEWDLLRENGRKYVHEARSWKHNVGIYDQLYRRMAAGRAWTH